MAGTQAARTASILVVDDDDDTRLLVVTTLGLAGYVAADVADADAAVSALEHGRFAAVVLDNHLPGRSGLELLRVLRAQPATRTLPVILLTGDSGLRDRVSGLRAGATDYVVKPFEPAELIARLEAHLQTHDAWGAVMDAQLRQRASLVQSITALGAARAPQRDVAAAACELVAGLEHLDGAAIMKVDAGFDVAPLAISGSQHWRATVERMCAAPAAFFAARADGAWLGADDSRLDAPTAFAPLSVVDRTIGVLVIGARRGFPRPGARVSDRLLAEAIDYATVLSSLLGHSLTMSRDPSVLHDDITTLIAARAFGPVFQPMIDLRDDALVGFEALTRFTDGASPEARFAEAHLVGDGASLELATMEAALGASTGLPNSAFVSINVSPTVVMDCTDQVAELLHDAPRPMVLELTEHHRVDDYGALRSAIDQLDPPVRVSIDDAGAGFASLRHVVRLDPDFVKLDRSWVTGIDDDNTRQALIAGLVHFAQETGCELVAEGIESTAERDTLLRLGVTIGQGFLLGRPAPMTRSEGAGV